MTAFFLSPFMMPRILVVILSATALPAYAQLDAAQMAAAREKAQVCFACHGPNGNSTVPEYPILAQQSWRYLFIELQDFKAGRRTDPQMSPMAANLSQEDMIALANYFAAQRRLPIKFQFDPAKVEAGRKIADAALCTMCHGGGFASQNEVPGGAGQWPQYIKKQLEDFKARRRTNDGGNMQSYAANLSEQDIEDLSQYIGNLQLPQTAAAAWLRD
jgi:cytochrome c553